MAHLFPQRDWWPGRPELAITMLKLSRWIVVVGTVIGVLSAREWVGILIIGSGIVSLSMLGGIRWMLELQIWAVKREEMAENRRQFPSSDETVEP